MKHFALLTLLLLISCQNQEWEPLVASENPRKDWIKIGGDAIITFDGLQVAGVCVPNSPNTFLATRKEYSDFELEYEVLIDDDINSGVQIRSHSRKDYLDGIVHGYQVELDPSSRSWSGGIYEEGKRGWLYSLENKPEAQKAFKPNDWNHFRVRAIKDSITTWVNGVKAAELVDTMESSGFIALQIHGIENRSQIGKQVRWRNLRIKELN